VQSATRAVAAQVRLTISSYEGARIEWFAPALRDTEAAHGTADAYVPISIRDAQNSAQDRTWIQAQYPEYLEDLSQLSMNTGMFPAAGEFGERQAEHMARWFADDSSHPLRAGRGRCAIPCDRRWFGHPVNLRFASFHMEESRC